MSVTAALPIPARDLNWSRHLAGSGSSAAQFNSVTLHHKSKDGCCSDRTWVRNTGFRPATCQHIAKLGGAGRAPQEDGGRCGGGGMAGRGPSGWTVPPQLPFPQTPTDTAGQRCGRGEARLSGDTVTVNYSSCPGEDGVKQKKGQQPGEKKGLSSKVPVLREISCLWFHVSMTNLITKKTMWTFRL